MKRIMLLVAFAALATVASANEDVLLSVRPDGVIPELPPAYETTRLRVAFSEGDTGALQQLDFLSSGRETIVQPCLLHLVPKGSFDRLVLTGFWSDDESRLPHYLHVAFPDWPYRSAQTPGTVHFLFSLRDASLLKVWFGGQYGDIRLPNGCPA